MSLHKNIAVDAASAKINMLTEKLIADTVESAKEIINKAAENRGELMIGHIERFNPIISDIKKSNENTKFVLIPIAWVGPLPPRVKDVVS